MPKEIIKAQTITINTKYRKKIHHLVEGILEKYIVISQQQLNFITNTYMFLILININRY